MRTKYAQAAAPAPVKPLKAGPAASPAPGAAAAKQPLQVGTTKTVGGKTYVLNRAHRWELADGEEPPEDAQPGAPSPQDDDGDGGHAERHAYVSGQLQSIQGPARGLMAAFHESPEYKSGGEYSTHDVHPKQAAALHGWLQQNAGQDAGGGKVVELGGGMYGFASPAGSMVVGPADESGKHAVHYTTKTGIVARGMKGGEGEQIPSAAGAGQAPAEAQAADAEVVEPEAPPVVAPPIAAPPNPRQQKLKQLQDRANQSRQQLDAAVDAWEEHMARGGDQKMNPRFRSHIASLKRIWSEHDQAARKEERDQELAGRRDATVQRRAETDAQRKAEQERKERARAEREAQRRLGVKGGAPKEPGQPAKEAAEKLESQRPGGRSLTRPWKAGYNTGSVEFQDDNHRDLHDLGAKMRKQATARNFSDAQRAELGRHKAELAKRMGVSESEVGRMAAAVHKENSRQMKGIGDGEHRKLSMPKDDPLFNRADGGGPVPTGTPESLERMKLPKRQQKLHSLADQHYKEHGVELSEQNRAALDHAIKAGQVRTPAALRAVFRTAKKLTGRKLKSGAVANEQQAFREAVRREANRESRESVEAVHKKQAAAWDMKPEEYASIAKELWPEFIKRHEVEAAASLHGRKLTGLTAKKIQEMENQGLDYSKHPNMDIWGEEVASQYGDLGWNDNHDAKLWELIKKGAKRVPGRASADFHSYVDEHLNQLQSQYSGRAAEVPDEEMEAVPFRKGGEPRRYAA